MKKITALYSRLSREDGDNAESCSIATQKRILEEYATNNGLTPFRHWVDDGVSGKDFRREGFQAMLAEIEAGHIGTVCVKNLDRFGRSYLESGLFREKFRQLGVRFIAVGDNVDSAVGDDAFTPFREVINEFYLSEYSKKIKAAFRSRGMAGKHTSSCCPYGYYKSPDDKNQWLVDEYAAEIVRRIFRLTMEGKGAYQICCILEEERIKTPGAYLGERGAGLHQKKVFENPYHWTSSTVCSILKKKEYLGHTVNFKSKKDSYKDKKNHYVPEDEWVIFENTHEPIIDKETFDNVQRIRGNVKRRPDGWGYVHPLTGLVWCSECGGKLYCHRTHNGKNNPQYICGNYHNYKGTCLSGHMISADTLMKLIKDSLRAVIDFANSDRDAFIQKVQETLSSKHTGEVKNQKKRLAECKKRLSELEILYRKIYEDNALGKLPDSRFETLSSEYEKEQKSLEKETEKLEKSVEDFEGGSSRAESFMSLVDRYRNFDELTTTTLNECIEKIIVHERDFRGSPDSSQTVEIHFNFIGEFHPPVAEIDPVILAEQEAEKQKKIARRERLHQNYLRRKAAAREKMLTVKEVA